LYYVKFTINTSYKNQITFVYRILSQNQNINVYVPYMVETFP